ncbi:MAG: hypothetical protein RL076_591 [Chloroflexota bacterium]
MRIGRSRIISLVIVVLFACVVLAFTMPYTSTTSSTDLDRILPIAQQHTLTFQNETSVEQWQITPLPYMLSVIFIPNSINVAAPAFADQRLFMLTRRIEENARMLEVREYYARTPTGDYLLGRVNAGQIVAYAPRILVRPQRATPESWNQFFTDGSGTITATQERDSAGCRHVRISGRDIIAWHEVLCDDKIRAQNHDSSPTQPALRTEHAVIMAKAVLTTPQPPSHTQFQDTTLTRIGNMQVHDNNEKVIAPLLVVQPQQLLIGSVTSGYLAAMRITDGSFAWEYGVSGDIYGAPQFDTYSGDIIFATTHKEVHRISANGMRRWSSRLSDPIVADPCATPAGVVVADTAGNVSLLAGLDGQHVWSYHVGANIVAAPVYLPEQQYVVVASQSGSITALNTQGDVVWQSENDESVLANVHYAANTVYVVGNEGSITAYAGADGDTQWINTINARTQWPVATHNEALAVATPVNVQILNTDGTVRAVIAEAVTAPPQFIADALILVSEQQILMVDFDGAIIASWQLDAMIAKHDSTLHSLTVATAPQYDTNSLYFADVNGRIFALTATTSPAHPNERWYLATSTEPMSSGAVAQHTVDDAGNLVVASSTQLITVIDGRAGTVRQQFQSASSLPPYALLTTTQHIVVADRMQVTAYKRTDGSVSWSVPHTSLAPHQLLYAGEYIVHVYQHNATQAMIRVFDAASGTQQWAFPYLSRPDETTAFVDDDAVYVNGIFRLAIADGSLDWISDIPLINQTRTDSAWCGVISIQKDAYGCVTRDAGKTITSSISSLPNGARLVSHPSQDLLVLSTPTHIWVKEPIAGIVRWERALESPAQDVVVSADGSVIVVYADGRFHIHDAVSGDRKAMLRDAPFHYSRNSAYGTLLPLNTHAGMLFLVSNAHILAFDVHTILGATP